LVPSAYPYSWIWTNDGWFCEVLEAPDEAKLVNEGDCANVQVCLVRMVRARAMGLLSLLNHPQKNAQHHVEHRAIALHVVPQPLGDREHPLAHRQAGEDVVAQVRRRLGHAPGVA
jgi:hypothetical protein